MRQKVVTSSFAVKTQTSANQKGPLVSKAGVTAPRMPISCTGYKVKIDTTDSCR